MRREVGVDKTEEVVDNSLVHIGVVRCTWEASALARDGDVV